MESMIRMTKDYPIRHRVPIDTALDPISLKAMSTTDQILFMTEEFNIIFDEKKRESNFNVPL
jgi:hypothetical protein